MGGWNRGLSSWNKGLTKKNDSRVAKISSSLKGRPKSNESKRKNSIAHQGKPAWNTGLRKDTDERVKRNGKKISKSKKGHVKIWNKGKTKETDPGVAKISEAKKRDIKNIEMLRNMTIKKPTKPQLKLFETIKTRFPDKEVVMEQLVKTPVGHKFIDVAIPDLKLGFEWDEPTYHGIFRGSKEKDAERHRLIEAEGWQLTHYSDILEFKK